MTGAFPPGAARRITAAEIRASVQGRHKAMPGVGLGLLALAALLDRRSPFDGADVDRLREAVGRLLDALVPSRPAVAAVAVPLRFTRPEPVRVAR